MSYLMLTFMLFKNFDLLYSRVGAGAGAGAASNFSPGAGSAILVEMTPRQFLFRSITFCLKGTVYTFYKTVP
jgi:hypothetical protein